MKKMTKLSFYLLLSLLGLSSVIIFFKALLLNTDLTKKLEVFQSPQFGMFVLFSVLIYLSIPNAKMFFTSMIKKIHPILTFLWRAIYVNNEAKIYTFIIAPIIIFELVLIVIFHFNPKHPFSFFLFFYICLYYHWLLLTIRTDMDVKRNICYLSDEKIRYLPFAILNLMLKLIIFFFGQKNKRFMSILFITLGCVQGYFGEYIIIDTLPQANLTAKILTSAAFQALLWLFFHKVTVKFLENK